MFKLAAVKKVTWPVVVQIPVDGGKVQKAEFDAVFEILEQDEHDEVAVTGRLLNRVLVGWARMKDEDGHQDIDFSPEQKAKLLNISYVNVALIKAYYEAAQGRKAERKN